MKTAGLILAAGESRRMGFPKALLEWRGQTFLDSLIGALAGYCDPVIVVLGADAARIRSGLRREAGFVTNPDYRLGQLTSMQCGLRSVPAESAGVLFTLVDHPNVGPQTLAALLRLDPERLPLLRIPRHQGRRGHPIFFSRALLPEFLALPPEGAARDVVQRHSAEIEYLDVPDAGILDDVDDPETYRRLTGKALA